MRENMKEFVELIRFGVSTVMVIAGVVVVVGLRPGFGVGLGFMWLRGLFGCWNWQKEVGND